MQSDARCFSVQLRLEVAQAAVAVADAQPAEVSENVTPAVFEKWIFVVWRTSRRRTAGLAQF